MNRPQAKNMAVVLVNLGSPVSPQPQSIRQFLSEFLSDPRVVEIPAWLWRPLLHCVILPLRAKRVAHLYQSIWTESGSPLAVMTKRQAELLQQSLQQNGAGDMEVAYAMTYGAPSLVSVIDELRSRAIDRILLIPLYPQYSGTTTGAIYDQVADIYRLNRHVPDIRVVRHYYQHELYVAALAESVRYHRHLHGAADLLLFSFHGIPQACVDKGDPYYEHCLYTARAVAELLGLKDAQWQVCFQSRFGKAKWLQPYTDEVLKQLPQIGVRRVDVICPAFASDCLETLEEIEVGSRACFIEAGGEYFARVPCLNDRDEHIDLLRSLVMQNVF